MKTTTFNQLLNTKQFRAALESAERTVFEHAYGYSGLNQSATAKLLGIARGTAITKLKQYGIISEIPRKSGF